MFKNLSVGKKIILGFSSVLVLLGAVGFIAYGALSAASDGFGEYREMARDNNLAGHLQADMLMVRMNVKDYIITGSDKDITQFKSYWKKMEGFQAEAQVEIHDPERAAMIDTIEGELDHYHNGFDEVVAFMNQRNKQVHDVLNVKGPLMENTLTEIMVSAYGDDDMTAAFNSGLAMKHLLLARIYMTKFLDTNDPAAVDRVHQEFGKMQEKLDVLDHELQNPPRREMLATVIGAKDAYSTTFGEMVTVIHKRNVVIKDVLDRIGPEVAQNVEDVKFSIKAVQDKLGPELVAANARSNRLILILCAAALIIGTVLATVITRGITKPLVEATSFAVQIGLGNTSDPRLVNDSKDETGQLAQAMNNMAESMDAKAVAAGLVADGDLTLEVPLASEKDKLGQGLQVMLNKQKTMIENIQKSTQEMETGATEIASASQDLASGAVESAASLEEISASLAEINSRVTGNAESAGTASSECTSVQGSAEVAEKAISDMNSSMKRINDGSQEIEKVIKVIDDIAFQTNLLALNAAVEAARAGKHGKGFAVVAEEVRNLAGRSAKAARETSDMITESIERATEGVDNLEEVNTAFEQISKGLVVIVGLIDDIAVASQDQARGISEITEGTKQIDITTQRNSANSEETASAAQELSAVATALLEMTGQFVVGENNFTSEKPVPVKVHEAADHQDGWNNPQENDILLEI